MKLVLLCQPKTAAAVSTEQTLGMVWALVLV